MKKLEFVIRGRVQGIRFRKTIETFVKANKLKGFVQNNEDGSVSGTLQGEEANLKNFISWVETNPGFSKITSFVKKISDIEKDKEDLEDFEIKKTGNFFSDKIKAVSNLFKSFGDTFSENEEAQSGKEELKIPNHIAIIPDGNRRWAKERGMPGYMGHEKAGDVNNLISLFNEAKNFGVKYISFWGFSTDNWKRDKEENDRLFNVLLKDVKGFLENAHENKIRFRHLGRKDRLSKEIVDALEKLEKETEKYSDYNVQLCLDYGGRDEIVRAVNKLLSVKAKKINEEQFSKVLDTNGIPEPDVIVRTSGEKRLSGFMPYQGVYAELIFIDKHFPDFKPTDVGEIILEFSRRKRRFGGGN